MSCSTLTQSAVRMQVSMGALPEGFCPETMQALADAIATRLIVTPSSTFTSFATGSVAPTSNVGPWFKDCLEWFVWDDVTAAYVPMTKGGFDNQQYFAGSTTFIVPSFIYKIRVSAWGGGGGGNDVVAAVHAAGGGGGGFASKIQNVTPGASITMVIGAGGAHAAAAGVAGGNTTIADLNGVFMTCNGGAGGVNNTGGAGGTATGGDYNFTGQAGWGISTIISGGGGNAGGGGGAGGTIGTVLAQRTGLAPGGGGSGGTQGLVDTTGGSGATGGALIEW